MFYSPDFTFSQQCSECPTVVPCVKQHCCVLTHHCQHAVIQTLLPHSRYQFSTYNGGKFLLKSIFNTSPDSDVWPVRWAHTVGIHYEQTKQCIYAKYVQCKLQSAYTHSAIVFVCQPLLNYKRNLHMFTDYAEPPEWCLRLIFRTSGVKYVFSARERSPHTNWPWTAWECG